MPRGRRPRRVHRDQPDWQHRVLLALRHMLTTPETRQVVLEGLADAATELGLSPIPSDLTDDQLVAVIDRIIS